MTKCESEILLFIKPKNNVSKNDILNRFLNGDVQTEARLDVLCGLGYLKKPPTNESYSITPKGLHELDEYLENQTRLDKVEKDNRLNRIIAIAGVIISAIALIVDRLV